MAGKPRPFIIEPSEFHVYLKTRMMLQKINATQLAESLGISVAMLYQLLNAEIEPNAEILKKVGLRILYGVDEDLRASEEDTPSPKGKTKK